jgi:eukaryotic-like serine/threonine-protein kinase
VTDEEELVECGAGPVATVYGGLSVAMKVYPSMLDSEVLRAFEQEQSRLAPLRGRAPVLPVDEVMELPDGRPAVRMQLCPASLAELVAGSGKLLVPDALAVGHDVAVAVAAAHRMGVVHGGLTPHNVLIHPSGAPVVTDFGVVLREAFEPSFDAEYAAPETLLDGTRDRSADLFGIGTVLFLALTGEAPLSPDGPAEMPHRDDIPPELARLVMRLLADRPEYRPATAGVVVRQLADMLAEMEKTSAVPDPVPAAETSRRRVKPAAVAGIAAGAAVLGGCVALAFTLWTNGQSSADPLPVRAVPATTTTAVAFVLSDPADQSTFVDLAWAAPSGLTFAVAVAAENEQTKVLLAHQDRAMRIPVEPLRKYCFQVQATDGVRVLESAAKPIRGAVCHK